MKRKSFFRETFGTEMITLRRGVKTDPALGTARGRKKFKLREAGRAGAFIRSAFLVLSAERAFGREEKIEKSTPEGARAHNLAGKL
jgi:hypothetical protein